MDNLPLEKQLTHAMFCSQIERIDLENAKKLLVELHHLYLAQQAMMVKIAKQDLLGGL